MAIPLNRSVLLGAALVLVSLTAQRAHPQTLLDVIGGSAIQNSLQSLPAGGASAVIERSRSTVDQTSLAEQQRLALLEQLGGGGGRPETPPGVLLAPLPGMAPVVGLAGSGPAEAKPISSAQVNGLLVGYCSHGGLCRGRLLQALGAAAASSW
ncbi:MAG: hypothetical protein AAFX65_13415 [Cyanobacteria bacterium J06638_7]